MTGRKPSGWRPRIVSHNDDAIAVLIALSLLGLFWALAIGAVWSVVCAWPVMLAIGIVHGWTSVVPAPSWTEVFVLLLALRLIVAFLTSSGLKASLGDDP